MNKFKLAVIVAIIILMLVLIFQNLGAVNTHLLFVKASMPLALLIAIVFGLGLLAGLLLRLNLSSSKHDS